MSVALTQSTMRLATIFKQFVAGVVAQAVVDEFEIVEIDEHHRHPAVVSLGMQHGLRQTVFEQGAVGQPGQRVMVGHEMNAVFGQLAFDRDAGDARGDIDEARLGVGRFAHRRRIHREGAERPRRDATGSASTSMNEAHARRPDPR